MPIRIISGITGAVLVVAVLLFNGTFLMLINILIALIASLAMAEICTVMGITKFFSITIPTLIFVSIMPIMGNSLVWQMSYYIYTVLMLGILLVDRRLKLKEIAIVYMMAMVITVSLSKIVEIRDFGEELGSFYVLVTLGIAWMSDTGAYFSGRYFGKNKLCPNVSPQKTIEGVIGGVVTCIVSLILIGVVFNNFIFPHKYQINYFTIIILALFGSLLSTLGDLCFSLIKRICHVKDFGNVIPGHGGILDRFDSVIFVAPYVYIFIRLVPII